MDVAFFRHNIEEEDIQEVIRVLRGPFLTTGPEAERFEEKLGSFLGGMRVVSLSSATAGLHLMLEALGVEKGDEVITTPLTFASTAISICHQGAVPIFADVEKDTGNLDVEQVRQVFSPRTKAILPVHLYGQMCDMKAFSSFAKEAGVVLVEDAAHALEANRDGIRPGALSQGACFSFYATKNLTCGEGGAVATMDPVLAERIRSLRLHGLSKDAAMRYSSGYQHYDIRQIGWKYNLNDILCALLIHQMDRLQAYSQRRQEIASLYTEGFQDLEEISLPKTFPNACHARHLYVIWVDPGARDPLLLHLQSQGIGVSVHFNPVHLMSYFRETYGFTHGCFPEAERIGASTVSLPFYPKLEDGQVQRVIEAVRGFFKKGQ